MMKNKLIFKNTVLLILLIVLISATLIIFSQFFKSSAQKETLKERTVSLTNTDTINVDGGKSKDSAKILGPRLDIQHLYR